MFGAAVFVSGVRVCVHRARKGPPVQPHAFTSIGLIASDTFFLLTT
jgi:hypothetical protein